MRRSEQRVTRSTWTAAAHLAAIATLALTVLACGDDLGPPIDIDATGGNIVGSVSSQGVTRTFILHVPPSDGPRQPAPLIIVYHGFTMSGITMQQLTRFSRYTEDDGFLVIYLDGLDGGWSVGCDCTTADALGIDDAALIDTLVINISPSFPIDSDRVYVAGFSQGGQMTQISGCRLATRVAAIASVSAVTTIALGNACQLARPLPILFIHGTDDDLVPFDGNTTFLSAAESTAKWVELNGCVGDPEVVLEPDLEPGDLTTVTRTTYSDCDGEAEVRFYTVEGGGHTWPQGEWPLPPSFGSVNHDISGSGVITDFFLQHSLAGS